MLIARNVMVDSTEFVETVNAIIEGTLQRYQPEEARIFRIDNWFDWKWLQFSGKAIGAVPVWDRSRVIIPPFVANRLTAQYQYKRGADGTFSFAGDGPSIHHRGNSGDNLRRRAKGIARGAALYWYSGGSETNGRGSLMGYVPLIGLEGKSRAVSLADASHAYWGFYIGFAGGDSWRAVKLVNIDRRELALFKQTHQSAQ